MFTDIIVGYYLNTFIIILQAHRYNFYNFELYNF